MRPQEPFTHEPALNATTEAFGSPNAISKIRFPASSGQLIDWTNATMVVTGRVCKCTGDGDLKGHWICPKCNNDFGTKNPGKY